MKTLLYLLVLAPLVSGCASSPATDDKPKTDVEKVADRLDEARMKRIKHAEEQLSIAKQDLDEAEKEEQELKAIYENQMSQAAYLRQDVADRERNLESLRPGAAPADSDTSE